QRQVEPWVVPYRAGAERVESRVDAEVARRELGEVAKDLRLRELGQLRRLGAAQRVGNAHVPQPVVARRFAAAPAGLRLLEDQLHAATSASTCASRSTSAGERFSVTQTSSASSIPS